MGLASVGESFETMRAEAQGYLPITDYVRLQKRIPKAEICAARTGSPLFGSGSPGLVCSRIAVAVAK